MTRVLADASTRAVIPAGSKLRVNGYGNVFFTPGVPNPYFGIGIFGPFPVDTPCNISATAASDFDFIFSDVVKTLDSTYTGGDGYPMRQRDVKLPRFSAALAKAKSGSRNCRIQLIGDSTSVGFGSTGAGSYGPSGRLSALGNQFTRSLNTLNMAANNHAVFGTNAIGTPAQVSTFDPRLVFTGTWSSGIFDGGFTGGSCFQATTTANLAFTPTAAGADSANVDTFVIWYIQSATAGTFNWNVDGGANTLITATNATPLMRSVTVSAGAPGAHTLNLSWVSSNMWILGIEAYDSTTKSIQLLNTAIGGSRASTFLNPTSNVQPWSIVNGISTIAPDLTIIQLTINDCSNTSFATQLDAYRTNISRIASIVSATGDVILRTGFPSAITFNALTSLGNQRAYCDVVRDIAQDNGYGFDDEFARRISYETQQAVPGAGMYSDSVHPNAPMYALSGYDLAKLVSLY